MPLFPRIHLSPYFLKPSFSVFSQHLLFILIESDQHGKRLICPGDHHLLSLLYIIKDRAELFPQVKSRHGLHPEPPEILTII